MRARESFRPRVSYGRVERTTGYYTGMARYGQVMAKGQLGPIRDTTTAALRWGRTVEMVPCRHKHRLVISDYGSVGIRELRIRLDG